MKSKLIAAVTACAALCATQAAIATPSFTHYGSASSFAAALGGAPTATQDFESLATGTSLVGVELVPGVTATTTGTKLEVFNSNSIGHVMFGTPRGGPEFHYELNVGSAYNAIGFDIQAFDPNAQPGKLDVVFADATMTSFDIAPGATETTPVFFGIVAAAPIASVRWSEPLEPLSGKCCEETGLDNIVVANAVPEPSDFALIGIGVLAVAGVARRRRA